MATNSPVFSLNRVRYAGFDFDTNVDELRSRLQVRFASIYNDFALASLGMMLVDIVSFANDTLSFYLDRRATEVYLGTLRTRRGAARVGRTLGYKMGGAVASSTDLSVKVLNPKSYTVSIPEAFQFQGPADLIFEAARSVDFSPAEQTAGVTKLVSVYEGEVITETFTSTGLANQTFTLARVPDSHYIASGSVEVTVDGAVWDEEDFLQYAATDQFEVAYNDDPPILRFGDGTAGNIPVAGASIEARYIATHGKAGEATKETIDDVVTPLVVAGEQVRLSVSNARKAVGGDDAEDIARVKANAGRVFNSRKLAIVQSDYTALAGSYASPVYGRVAVAEALSSRSAEDDLVLRDATVAIRSALEGAVAVLREEIASATDDPTGSLYLILAYCSDIGGALSDIQTSVGLISTNNSAIVSSVRSGRNLTLDVDAEADAGKAAVDNITTDTTSTLTDVDKTLIKSYFDVIKTKNATMRSGADSQVSAAGVITDEIDKVGLSISAVQISGADSYLKVASDAQVAIETVVGTYDETTPSASTGLFYSLQYVLVTDVADVLDPNLSDNEAATVFLNLERIWEHLDRILSTDCKANLVSVPILVRDAAGFYTEPSNGLIDILRDYLDERKEVTQTVEVVSGGRFLIFPIIRVRLGVLQGYSLEQSESAAYTAIDGILRDRAFGLALYVSDFDVLKSSIEGVKFVNVEIEGYITTYSSVVQTDKLDTDGNLVIARSEVITKAPDTVTVDAEVYVSA